MVEQFKYIYKPYSTGTVTYTPNETTTSIRIEVNEDSSLATMIASEATLSRDWDTPEEDEAWSQI